MPGADLLDEAVAELYTADPEEFTRRRQEFAGRAREAGQAAVARQIAALRKPTRSAWVINQLARSDPDAVAQLNDLGRDLRAAERARDGGALRELAQRRRQLIARLVRQALTASGQAAAPAGMREELTGTFAAAIADPEVAGQIQQGTLVRAVLRAAFGSDQPALSVVPPPPGGRQRGKAAVGRAPASKPKPAKARAAKTGPAPAETGPEETAPRGTGPGRPRPGRTAAAEHRRAQARAADEQRRAEARAAQERRRAEVRAKAERAVADAGQAVAAAAADQQEQEKAIRRLERELADARRRLRAAGADARRAEAAQRRARQALDRLDG